MNKIVSVIATACVLSCSEPSISEKTKYIHVPHGSCDVYYTPAMGNLYKEVYEDSHLIDFTVIILDGSKEISDIIKQDSLEGCK